MSVTTLIISVAALGISAVNLVLNWRRHPRPRLAFEWTPERHVSRRGVPFVRVRVRNEGTASARGVRLNVVGSHDRSKLPWYDTLELPVGDSYSISVPLMHVERRHTANGAEMKLEPEDQTDLVRPVLVVRYAGRARTLRERAPKIVVAEEFTKATTA